jgi:hypothetical protein
MRLIGGASLVLALLLCAACGTGNRQDLPGDGPGGGELLPNIEQVDSGNIPLTNGQYLGSGNDLILSDPSSGAAARLVDQTFVTSGEQIYDTDGNGVLDYFIMTIRALSAQGAGSVKAYDGDPDDTVDPGLLISSENFVKVGGAAFEPLDAAFTVPVQLTLPVNPDYATKSLQLYKFRNLYLDQFGRTLSDDVGTNSGYWVQLNSVTLTNNGDNTYTFSVPTFGEYCLAFVHDQGSGSDI